MWRTTFAVTAFLWLAVPGQAFATDWDDCNQNGNDAVRLRGCSRIIDSGVRRDREIAFNNRGLAYFHQGNFQQAIADYDAALKVTPGYTFPLNNRCLVYHEMGQYDRAIADCTQAIRLDPRYVYAYNNRGRSYHAKGDYDRAIADYDQAIRLDPRYALAYNNRAFSYHEKGNYDQAIADCNEAIRIDPKSALPFNNRGRAFQEKNDLERAVADYDEAIRLDPQFAFPYNNRGNILRRQGKFDKAVADFDQAIRLKPKYALAYNNRGLTFYDEGEFDRAAADYEEAIRLDPNSPLPYNNRGLLAYRDKRDYDRAIADYDKAIRLSPGYAIAYNNRGLAYYAKGDYDRAIADYGMALRADPNYTFPYNNRGLVFHARGDFSSAIADYDEAIRLDSKYANAYSNRGYAYQAQGDFERAIADYDEALRLDPKAPNAADRRAQAMQHAAGKPVETERTTGGPVKNAAKPTLPQLPTASTGRRVALVIGNSGYKMVSPLPNPRHDAAAIAAELTQLGFEVMARFDLTVGEMRRTLAEFEDKVSGADWALVFYAGHGMEFDGRNWLIPVDARLAKLNDVPDETIGLDRVMDRVNGASKLRIVMLDACRNNPFLSTMQVAGRSRAVERGLAKIEPEHGEVVFYAARDGNVAIDGIGEHSPFTTALLKHMNEDGLELGRFFRKVTSSVLKSTDPKQEPFVYGRLPDEDFFFVPPKTVSTDTAQ